MLTGSGLITVLRRIHIAEDRNLFGYCVYAYIFSGPLCKLTAAKNHREPNSPVAHDNVFLFLLLGRICATFLLSFRKKKRTPLKRKGIDWSLLRYNRTYNLPFIRAPDYRTAHTRFLGYECDVYVRRRRRASPNWRSQSAISIPPRVLLVGGPSSRNNTLAKRRRPARFALNSRAVRRKSIRACICYTVVVIVVAEREKNGTFIVLLD